MPSTRRPGPFVSRRIVVLTRPRRGPMGQLTGIILDHALDAPLYRQIFDQVVLRIRTGAYPVGYRLPPTRSLARELSTNRNTVVRVYEDLESAGFVSSRVGRGTFVSEPPRSVPLPTLTERPPLP